MHITPELEAELNAEQTTDENKNGFSSFSAMLKARYGAGETCNYEEAYQAWLLDARAEPIETAVEEVIVKKAMLSQPMAGKSQDEIVATREKAIAALTDKGFEIVNTLFTDDWYKQENMEKRGVVQIPLCFLAKSLENMSLCHAAYFCKGWENARGCKIEHDAAVAYGLDVIYEK